MPGCHHLVSGTFHPHKNGCFSAFPRGTKYTIGLKKYSELEVDASQIHAQYPMNATQEQNKANQPVQYGTITLYG